MSECYNLFMNCETNVRTGSINLRRLFLLVGLVAVIIAASVSSVLVSPAFISVLPLLFFVAMCPLMCIAHRLVSWVKGGGKVRERMVLPAVIPEVKRGTEERSEEADHNSSNDDRVGARPRQ